MKKKKKKASRMVILKIDENEMEIQNSLRMIGRNEFCDFTRPLTQTSEMKVNIFT